MTFDVADAEHTAWRARIDELVSQHLAVVDVTESIDLTACEDQNVESAA